MMEIINELSKQELAKDMREHRTLNSIEAGRYRLSVQGSCGHYCSPRATLRPSQYERMELAIFYKGEWVHPTKNKKLKSFPRYDELIERADGISSFTVYGYVPVDLLNDLYLYFRGK